MKKFFLISSIFLLVLLCGCGLSAQRREMEQLRIIQTVGMDYEKGSVRLTLAAAAGPEGEGPGAQLSGTGRTLSAALEQIRENSVEEELFMGHIRAILVGQEAAEHGLNDLIAVISRSNDLRLDIPLYLVRGGTAAELMQGASSDTRGITEILQSAQLRSERQRSEKGSTADAVQRALIRSGGALVTALRFGDAAEQGDKTAVPAGFGVLKSGTLCAWVEPEDALAAELLCGKTGCRELSVLDLGGLPVSLELQRGESTVTPVWNDDGSLRGLDVTAYVQAAVLETGADSADGLARYDDYLTGQLEAAISEKLGRILQLARQESLDLAELTSRLERSDPRRFRALKEDLGALLPGLEISLTVQGELTHSFDAKEA